MKFLINTHHTKGPCAGLFNYVISIIQLFYYLIKPFCVLATTNFSTFRIYYMEKWQEDFTAIFYRIASSSFQMHSLNIPSNSWQDIFTEFQSLVFHILLATNIMRYKKIWIMLNLTYIQKKRMETRIIKNIFNTKLNTPIPYGVPFVSKLFYSGI